MLCRQIILSVVKKRCFHIGLQARNVAYGYIEGFHNSYDLGNSINCRENANRHHNLKLIKRFKYNKKPSNRKENEESDNEDDDNDDIPQDKNSPIVSLKVNSLRVDLILKAGLNIARNKVETAFYESKIRVNGRKIFKKSEQLRIGDEVDLVRGPSPTNPDFLVVSRVQILTAKENAENITVKLSRSKSLVIENYEDPWKSVGDEKV